MLEVEPTGGPVAEAWWGAHDSGPSQADMDGALCALDEAIAREPESMLGARAVERWGDRLPYLLKVLSIGKPLSIQVHPTLAQAREGFAREQRGTGGAPHHFLDPFHKPEMVVAITRMEVLSGVRPIEATASDLRALKTGRALGLASSLERSGDVRDFIRGALSGGVDQETLEALARVGANADPSSSLAAAARALRHFPGDAGAIVALGMHAVRLEPGDAVFVGAGVLHSYQSGMGLEIMANSDNVVRAGLTPKTVNVPLLLDLLNPEACDPVGPQVRFDGAARHLITPADEFALTIINDGRVNVAAGPRIVLCVRGECHLVAGGRELTLTHGQAAFVRDSLGQLELSVDGGAVVARTPYETERPVTHAG